MGQDGFGLAYGLLLVVHDEMSGEESVCNLEFVDRHECVQGTSLLAMYEGALSSKAFGRLV